MRATFVALLHFFFAGRSFCSGNAPLHNKIINPTVISQNKDSLTQIISSEKKVLILDVDNTLYKEADLRSTYGFGIEEQIINRTHEFGKKYYNLDKDECDEMYFNHGSTVEGLRYMLKSQGKSEHEIKNALRFYYNEVYNGIDMSCLLLSSGKKTSNTGYSHEKSAKERQILIDLLSASQVPIYLASNSPRGHVLKVIKALGLANINYEGILTPDSNRDHDAVTEPYPTKSNPLSFYHPLLQKFDSKHNDIILLDDSSNNLNSASDIGIKGFKIHGDEGHSSLRETLSRLIGHLDLNSYKFSDVKYLQSKNAVDLESINSDVWERLTSELAKIIEASDSNVLRIVDLGAGLLSMLQMILDGGGGKESLLDVLRKSTPVNMIEYIAYESNKNLLNGCWNLLDGLGFVGLKSELEDEYIFELLTDDGINVVVKLRVCGFSTDTFDSDHNPHLVIGCCFADLFEPNDLSAKLMKLMKHCNVGGGVDACAIETNETLVYFPITFAGVTQFLPPKPFDIRYAPSKIIPSDSFAFHVYAQSLIEQNGHNLDPKKLISAMLNNGGKLIHSGPSIWDIDPDKNNYLWETMMYFFASSTGPMMCNWDFQGWIKRARDKRPNIRVLNEDILFSVCNQPNMDDLIRAVLEKGEEEESSDFELVEEIIFNSPYNVSKVTKRWETKDSYHLKPGQVEGKTIGLTKLVFSIFKSPSHTAYVSEHIQTVKAICSLISSGTELKIFKGLFDDAPLDVNIKGMADESMNYPLSYGYSLVGVVTKCAPDVLDAEYLIGKTVFTFSPHSSHVIVDRASIHVVPDGIDANDAIFMPSVETALSLVHDAHPRMGENVAVYGQGLIGLLVNAILSLNTQTLNPNGKFNVITAIDTLSDRLAMASQMGASQVILPSEVNAAGPFDVSIEVSGNSRALQSAIDNTRNGGRIIVGSWYGNADIKLKLGIDFHRSHKTIKTSQVSTIPGELSSLWSKDRRFELTWELVKLIKPSRLTTKKVTLDDAQSAYELLDQGKEIAISFVYNKIKD